jgi:CheY-like chemotaxis protein
MSSPGRIVVADDEEIIRLVLARRLTARGFEVSTAVDGGEALRLLTSDARVDVLVTDLEMPVMDGLALMQEIRERGLLTRCVVVTGYAGVANLIECLRQGAVALVPKPITDLGVFDKAVDDALAQMRRWSDQIRAVRAAGGADAG